MVAKLSQEIMSALQCSAPSANKVRELTLTIILALCANLSQLCFGCKPLQLRAQPIGCRQFQCGVKQLELVEQGASLIHRLGCFWCSVHFWIVLRDNPVLLAISCKPAARGNTSADFCS